MTHASFERRVKTYNVCCDATLTIGWGVQTLDAPVTDDLLEEAEELVREGEGLNVKVRVLVDERWEDLLGQLKVRRPE